MASLLAPAAAFYAVGYLIIHAYVRTTKLFATFWLQESQYREAGAAFLIDILMSAALLPHVFLAMAALLIGLFPTELDGRGRRYGFGGFHFRLTLVVDPLLRRRVFYAVICIGVVIVAVTLLHTPTVTESIPDAFLVGWWMLGDKVLDDWQRNLQPNLKAGALFFAVAIPLLVALGALATRVLRAAFAVQGGAEDPVHDRSSPSGRREAHPFAALLLAGAFVALSVFIPVGYGVRFYDTVVIPLNDPKRCADNAAAPSPQDCYLLGRYDTRYVLIGIGEVKNDQAGEPAGPNAAVAPFAGVVSSQKLYIKQVAAASTGLEPFTVNPMNAIAARLIVSDERPN